MNRNRAHGGYPSVRVASLGRLTVGKAATCYACDKPIHWDGHRWTHTPTPVKGKR